MARAKSANVATSDEKKMESKAVYKTSVVMVGILTMLASLSGVVLSVLMVVKGLTPLQEFGKLCNETTVLQTIRAENAEFQKSSQNIFVGILGFFLVALGVPNAMHAVYSLELIFGAWKERPKMIMHWVLFTESTTSAHAVVVLGLVVGLFWIHRMLLALVMFANFIVLFLISSFFLNIVQIYYSILESRVLPDVLFRKNKQDIIDVEAEVDGE